MNASDWTPHPLDEAVADALGPAPAAAELRTRVMDRVTRRAPGESRLATAAARILLGAALGVGGVLTALLALTWPKIVAANPLQGDPLLAGIAAAALVGMLLALGAGPLARADCLVLARLTGGGCRVRPVDVVLVRAGAVGILLGALAGHLGATGACAF